MNKKFKTKNLSIFLSLLLISTFVSCSKIDKETILSPNVTEDIKVEENEVKVTLEKGNSYLNDNDFANAKLTYEKAISIDKVNKDIYLEIKDKYLDINRFDDALYFVQLALNNNTDIDNMKIISDNIKSKFEITSIDKSLYEGESYTLPSELSTKINNENISIPVTWNNSVINTSTAGTFSYTGINKEYSRQFTAILTVLPTSKVSSTDLVQATKPVENKKDIYIEKIGQVKASMSDLAASFDGTTLDQYFGASEEYLRWDNLLNEIYSVLKEQMSTEDFEKLKNEQIKWINDKDPKAKESAKKFEGGSQYKVAYSCTLGDLTEDRCNYLVNNYMK